jgi:hypothetical protein
MSFKESLGVLRKQRHHSLTYWSARGMETNLCYNAVEIPPDRQLSVQQEQSDPSYGVSHVTPQDFCVLSPDI